MLNGDQRHNFQWKSLKTRVTLFSLIMFMTGIWSLEYYSGRMLQDDLRRLLGEQQLSTVSIVAAEVNHEIDFRLKSLEKIASGITPEMFSNAAKVQALLEDRPLLDLLYNGGNFVVKADGRTIADHPILTGRIGMDVSEKGWMTEALQGKSVIGKPVLGKQLNVPVFTLAVPIHGADKSVIGVLAGVIDLSKPSFLDNISNNRYGKSGDFLLVSPRYRMIVTASDKRRIMEQLPAPGINPVLDRFIDGYEGFETLVNPLGSKVLVAAKGVPAAGWYVAAIMPVKEAFAPILVMQQRMLGAAIVLTFVVGGLTWWILRRQLSPLFSAVRKLSSISEEQLPLAPLPASGDDEVGQLISGFNGLLDTLAHRERALIESDERHRSILRTANNGIWLTDMHGGMVEVNKAYCRMSGYREEELLIMNIADLEVNESPDDVARHIQAIKERGEAHFESRHRRKDGSIFDVEVSVQFRPTDGGQCVAFLQDITERKNSEVALLQSEKRLKEAQRIASMGNWELDLSTGALVWSDEIFRIFEIDQQQFGASYQAFLDAIHPDDRRAVNQAYTESLVNRKPYEITHRLLMADGRIKFVVERCETVFEQGGTALRSIGTVQDITGTKLAEEERGKLERQLQQAQKLESVGRLAGGVAHDFNNMLTIITGYAQLGVLDSEASSPLRNYFEEISKTSDRSADLTRQLLAFARKQTIAPRELNLNETVTGMLKMLQRLIGEGIRLVWQPAPTLWRVKVDPSQVDQILANLCVNARDAIAGIGVVTIETGNRSIDENYAHSHADMVAGEYVVISVSDTGCGIDKETLAHIFEPFFTTKKVGEGTGLGLATVYGIARQNNGFVNVYSEPGLGTTFTIYLPRYAGPSAPSQTAQVAAEMPKGTEIVLLVEDEPSILKITAAMLEKQGYTVLTTASPKEAVSMADGYDGRINLLITDVIMPEMNGHDLSVRLQSAHPHLRCLYMSGYTADVIAPHGVLEDGVSFIQKPFTISGLTKKVRAVLDGDS